MKQRNILTQTQTQTQQLSAMQLALAQMVELPLAQYAERIECEMMDNAALEENDRNEGDRVPEKEDDDWGYGDDLDLAIGDYRSDDDIPSYLQDRAEYGREEREYVMVASHSLYDDLKEQIGEQDLTPHETQLLEYLIGSLDDGGFLRKDLEALCDELAIYHNIYTDQGELARMLSILHTFEPRGIGARDLQECLLIQLTHPDYHSSWQEQSVQVVEKYFKQFMAKRWDIIAERMQLSEDETRHIQQELTRLNPSPGRALDDDDMQSAVAVIPDFFVLVGDDGSIDVQLNQGDVPQLRVSRSFQDIVYNYFANDREVSRQEKEGYIYAKQKVESAQNFINLIERRQQTLLAVMHCIIELQRPFFLDEDENLLRPLTIKEVAERAGMDKSTASRVVGGKYVQTRYGLYPLKYFFSSGFVSAEGEEVSTRQIKSALVEIIDAEDKVAPLGDEELALALKDKGFPVARRTVSKYREQLGIPVARLRKQ
jgi:RNA polymerase sigma-54 factor